MKRHGNKNRLMCVILSVLMIVTNTVTSLAVGSDENLNSKTEIKKGISQEILVQNYPLSYAYLNNQLGTAIDQSEKVYIVEFEDGYKEKCIAELEKIPGLEIKYEYHTIFPGVSIKLKADKINQVRDMEGVKHIQENGKFVPQMSSAKQITKIKEAVEYYEKSLPESERKAKKLDGRGTVVAIIDSGIDINHEAMRIDDDAKVYMKIKQHDPGFTDKVPHGFSYVGGGNNLMDNVVAGHGMHCAGIIAGNSEELKGVVPNAQIFSYRIFSDSYYGDKLEHYEYGGDDAVYHAIDDAVARGADVISMSIGQAGNGYAGDIYYDTVNRAADAGVVIVSAIGNYGSAASDNTFDSNPSVDVDVMDFSAMTYYAGIGRMLAVGAATNTSGKSRTIKIGEKTFPYKTLGSLSANEPAMDMADPQLDFVYVGHGRKSAYMGRNVKGKVVIVVRDGSRTKGSKIVEKVREAQQQGAKGIIIMNAPIAYSRDNYMEYPIISYMNDPEISDIVETSKMWAIGVNGTDGAEIKKFDGTKQSVAFPKAEIDVPLAKTVRMSGFSGWGPNAELELKPEIVAPGENIYSSMNRNRYGYMSGTSMATPHVAGISAMMVQKVKEILAAPYFSDLKAADINKILLMNTAEPLKDDIESDLEVSPRRQGAGMVRADKAIKNDVLVTYNKKAAVELKDFNENQKTFKIRIDNLSNEERTYQLKYSEIIGQGVVNQEKLLLSPDKIVSGQVEDTFVSGNVKVSVPKKIEGASISSDRTEITVSGKGYVEVPITLSTPEKPEGYFVEGYIYLDAKDPEAYPCLSLPYLGFKGDWQSGPIIDKPMWDEDSIYKHTTVVGVYADDGHGEEIKYKILGVDEKAYPIIEVEEHGVKKKVPDERFLKEGYKVNPDNISFGIGFMAANPKEVALRMVALREVKDLEVAIVNRDKKVVRVLSRSQNFRKQIRNVIFESEWQTNVYNRPDMITKWDGKIYTPKPVGYEEYSDGMVGAPSGQYYYRIRARVKDSDNFEETFLPVYLDNKEPLAGIEDIKYTMNENGQSRDVYFKVKDDHAVMFVGASLDGKPVEVKNLGQDEYFIEGLKINELTHSHLHIEAMDYATNLMNPIEIDLNSKFMSVENYEQVVSGESDKLQVKVDNDAVFSLEAYQDNIQLEVENNQDIFNILLAGKQDVKILGKDENGNIIGERNISIVPKTMESAQSEVGHNTKFGPIDYVELSDEDSNDFREAFDYDMMNYYILGKSSTHISKEEGKSFFNPSEGWHPGFLSGHGYNAQNYKVSITAYNTLHSDYETTYEEEWELNKVNHDLHIPVYDGTNIFNITVTDKHTGKVAFSRGVLVMYDSQAPVLTLDNANVFEEENKIYANSNELLISGKVEDNLDEVYLSLNGDNVVTKLKQGDFEGETSGRFEATIHVENEDFVSFRAKDRFGNYKDTQYKVVMDTEEPVITIEEQELTNDSVLEPTISDNIAIREQVILVNGKPYENGKSLNAYGDGKYHIEIIAIDRAGNKAEKVLNIGLTDADKEFSGVTISKNTFTRETVANFRNYVVCPEGITVDQISDITPELGKQNVIVTVKNKFGITQDLTFEITILEEDITNEKEIGDIVLKQTNFLPEELTVENLFDLPDGVSVRIDPIDASTVGEKNITAVFSKGTKTKTETYTIRILPVLDARLKQSRIALDELKDISNVIQGNSEFEFSYKENPKQTTGLQNIVVVIKDNFGHSKEMVFTIEVYKKEDSSSSSSSSSSDSGSGSNSSYNGNLTFKEPKYHPVGDNQDKEYKKNNTSTGSKKIDFNDTTSHWAKSVVKQAVQDNIVNGYPDGTFRPDNKAKRSEFVVLANKFFGYTKSEPIRFNDVVFSDWFRKDLQSLVAAGLVQGDEGNNFLPNKLVTREEIASIFIRYIEKEKPSLLEKPVKALPFLDKEEISDWAKDAVFQAYSIGLLKGNSQNLLKAKDAATRAEVIRMIYNLKEIIEK